MPQAGVFDPFDQFNARLSRSVGFDRNATSISKMSSSQCYGWFSK
jgi:hypothetical protein